MIRIELAGPPMAKERVRVTREGHAYTPQRTVNYEAKLALAAQQVMAGRPLLDRPLRLTVVAFKDVPKSKPKRFAAAALAGLERPLTKPDADNYAKIVDALNLIVWTDDAIIVDMRSLKFFSDRPRMVIQVETFTDEMLAAAAAEMGAF